METIVIKQIDKCNNKKYKKIYKKVLTKQASFTIIKTTKQQHNKNKNLRKGGTDRRRRKLCFIYKWKV